ncbi:7742_t:CDS:2, partial [Racocetra persica]
KCATKCETKCEAKCEAKYEAKCEAKYEAKYEVKYEVKYETTLGKPAVMFLQTDGCCFLEFFDVRLAALPQIARLFSRSSFDGPTRDTWE